MTTQDDSGDTDGVGRDVDLLKRKVHAMESELTAMGARVQLLLDWLEIRNEEHSGTTMVSPSLASIHHSTDTRPERPGMIFIFSPPVLFSVHCGHVM